MRITISLLLFSLLALAGCASKDTVTLYKDRGMRAKVTVPKLDPDMYKQKQKELQLTLKVELGAGFLYSKSAQVTAFHRAQSTWNALSQAWHVRWLLLVNEVNTAHITYDEYKAWERRLDRAYQDMARAREDIEPLREDLLKALADRAQEDLETELAKGRVPPKIEAKLEPINEKVDEIEQQTASLLR